MQWKSLSQHNFRESQNFTELQLECTLFCGCFRKKLLLVLLHSVYYFLCFKKKEYIRLLITTKNVKLLKPTWNFLQSNLTQFGFLQVKQVEFSHSHFKALLRVSSLVVDSNGLLRNLF